MHRDDRHLSLRRQHDGLQGARGPRAAHQHLASALGEKAVPLDFGRTLDTHAPRHRQKDVHKVVDGRRLGGVGASAQRELDGRRGAEDAARQRHLAQQTDGSGRLGVGRRVAHARLHGPRLKLNLARPELQAARFGLV